MPHQDYMSVILYDLCGADPEVRFSPFCWRIRLALAHKRIQVETIPWRHGEKATIAFSGQALVPVLVDGKTVVSDSWKIAKYLDETYPERPLITSPHVSFIKTWTDGVLHPAIMRNIVLDILKALRPEEREIFRSTREPRFGMTLEEFAAEPEKKLAALRGPVTEPLRQALRDQPFLGGATPDFADYIVFGAFQWARCASPKELLAEGDPIRGWRERLLDLFDGLARNVKKIAPSSV